MFLRPFNYQQRTFGRALSCHHAARFHDVEEFGARSRRVRHSPAWWIAHPAPVASSISFLALVHTSCRSHYSSRVDRLLHSSSRRLQKLATTPVTTPLQSRRLVGGPRGIVGTSQATNMPVDVKYENGDSVNSPGEENAVLAQARTSELPQDVPPDPESDEDIPVQAEELQEALSRPPPVNSSYLPLPWKGRLGYVSDNQWLIF